MYTHKKIIKSLINKKISLSTAESCTGGLLSYSFIKNKDISKIFKVGMICYSNESKIKLLKVNKNIIDKYGAVSSVVAKTMSENLKKISSSNLCISTTGIAGPKGHSKNKPVGLVYICIIFNKKKLIFKKKFNGSRIEIQKKTINFIFREIKKLI